MKKSIFQASNGLAWLTEAARPTGAFELTDNLIRVAQNNPVLSGYGDAMGSGAEMEAQADAVLLRLLNILKTLKPQVNDTTLLGTNWPMLTTSNNFPYIVTAFDASYIFSPTIVNDFTVGLTPGAPLAHEDAPDNRAGTMRAKFGDSDAVFARAAHVFRERIFQHFSQKAMVEGVLAGYRDAFAKH